jgi:NAD(P)H-hydrate repair Nnr-like enzyme with NAD(P)H-hydrate epimerase domain
MGVPIASEPAEADLVIDALIGYSLRGNPAGRAAELIEATNRQPAPVLALDVRAVWTSPAAWPAARASRRPPP